MSGKYNRKDHFYQRAKDEGFRSRAAYKLQELDKKFHFLRKGANVLDLGAWPGGWLQIAAQAVGNQGRCVGIDLKALDPLPQENVTTIVGDVSEESVIEQAVKAAGGMFDLILSDMAPSLTGIPEVDQYGSVNTARLALSAAGRSLKTGGAMIVKVFKGRETDLFVKEMGAQFQKVKRVELDATRKSSNEFYIVGLSFRGTPKVQPYTSGQ